MRKAVDRALVATVVSVVLATGCSQSTGPGGSGPDCVGLGAISGGHPAAGVIDSIYPLTGRPFGVAINSVGTVLVSRQDLHDIVRGNVSNFVLGNSSQVGNDPGTLDISPNGSTAAEANYTDFDIGLFDIATNALIAGAPVVSSPMQVKFHPDNTRLYVGTVSSGLYVFNNNLVPHIVQAGKTLNGMAFSPSTCKIYVSSQDSGYVAEINTAADTIVRKITVGSMPEEVAISPDSSELWVADEIAGVQVYTLPSGAFSATVTGTSGAWGLAMSPDGQQLYATLPTTGKIKIISRTGRNVIATLNAGVPRRLAFDFPGTHVVVADETLGAILIR
jgi:YVTN family beta-propeller protein